MGQKEEWTFSPIYLHTEMQIIYIEKIKEENRTLLMDATGGLTRIDKNMEVYLLKDISDLRKLGFP